MEPGTVRRRHLLLVAASGVLGAGCGGIGGQSGDTPTESATESSTRSASPSRTPTDDCQYYALLVYNQLPREVTVHLTITANSRWSANRGPSPTPNTATNTTPTETPVETFSDTITLGVDGDKKYRQVSVTGGDSVLEVTVEDGPRGKVEINRRMVARNREVFVNIREEEVSFTATHVDCPQ